MAPLAIEFQGSSLFLMAMRAQSNVEYSPPHTAKFPEDRIGRMGRERGERGGRERKKGRKGEIVVQNIAKKSCTLPPSTFI